ncbi:MAG: hypothetical protein L6V93_19850 [Clostridiales bacterium]|nr:MAG: hypothetical protein L6V93_19850 [Clostridiales bacterium]
MPILTEDLLRISALSQSAAKRCLVGCGGGNTLYLIAEGGTYSPVKTYDAPPFARYGI